MIFFLVSFQEKRIIYIEWIFYSRKNLSIYLIFLLDLYSILFLLRVSVISLRVLIFRINYMQENKFNIRFNLLVFIFILRMYFLILSPNLIRVLLGWDGLGLSSYLLVIYYSNRKSFNSGIITALSNRVGDLVILFLIRVFILNYSHDYLIVDKFRRKILFIFLVLARRTKRAQIPFSAWLPAAMAAPTPVSALVHSSTLVTAGVYLLIRHESIFLNKNSLIYLFYIGVFTRLIASIRALKESDLKKIVALSTLRQLGLMVSMLGLGIFKLGFLHLLAHAFFKALMFIITGNIIHFSNNGQDMRFIGRKLFRMNWRKRVLLICRISLAGLPFISAFYSKEIFLEIIYFYYIRRIDLIIFIIRVVLTGVYSLRFIYFFFNKLTKTNRIIFVRDNNFYNQIAVRLLILLAIFGGKILSEVLMIEILNSSLNSVIFLKLVILLQIFVLISRYYYNFLKFSNIVFNSVFIFRLWGLNWFSWEAGRVVSLNFSKPLLKIREKGAFLNWYSKNLVEFLNLGFRASYLYTWIAIFIIWRVVFLIYYLDNILKIKLS